MTPPQPGHHLHRPRLLHRLDALAGVKAVLVTAGAGYGKTTLVAQALEASDAVAVWYRLDEFDADFTTFMTYLSAGLSAKFSEADPAFFHVYTEDFSETVQQDLLLKFARQLEACVDKETIIVLDDFHLIGTSERGKSVHQAVSFLLARLPETVHMILISRKDPPIELSTLRVRQQLMEIHEPDLAFTLSETRAFFNDLHNLELDRAVGKTMTKKNQGWAAGLILLAAAMRKSPDLAAETPGLLPNGSRRHIFSFLEENLFAGQPEPLQSFMLQTSLLEIMPLDLCRRVTGMENALACFRQMMSDHLMVFPCDAKETSFCYHHLFRDFLRDKLKETFSQKRIHALHSKIARQMEACDNVKAVWHYIEAGAFDAAARMIQSHGFRFLIRGEIFFVRTCLERIPGKVISETPVLLFMAAKLDSYFGNPHKAIENLKSALIILRRTGGGPQVGTCLVDIGAQYYYTGHIPEARGIMEQVLDEIETDPITYMLALTYLIFFNAVLGDIRRAETYEKEAGQALSRYPEFQRTAAGAAINTSVTSIYYFTGQFERSQKLNRSLLGLCLDQGLDAFLPLLYFHLSVAAAYLGDYREGLEFAEKGILAARKIYLRDSQKGWVYIAWGENSLGCGDLDTAFAKAEKGLEIFRRPGNRWGIGCSLELMARIALAQKKVVRAGAYVAQALEVVDGYGLDVTQGIISVTKARILIAQKRYNEAQPLLENERKSVRTASYHLFFSWLLQARCEMAQGNRQQAMRSFLKCTAIARKRGYGRILEQQGADLLSRTAERGNQEMSLTVQSGTAGKAGLNIRLLGRFEVYIGHRKIADKAWASSKSLLLFQYLAAHRQKGYIPKEVLLEVLWPNQDPERTGKRFNVAVSRLRKLLEPDLERRSPSAYIRRKKDRYRLSLGPGGTLDLDEFTQKAETALSHGGPSSDPGFASAAEALALFRGAFLETVLYEEWCIRKRDRIAALYRKLLVLAADHCRAQNMLADAVQYAEKLVAADPYNEDVFRRLMALYGECGQTARAVETFEACKEKMARIDCPVSGKTLDLYHRLTGRPLS